VKILALDIGLKRIGLAISQDMKISTPLSAILRKNREQASREVDEVIRYWNIDKLVIGIPNGSNREEMFRRFSHFVSLLNFGGEIFYQDEDFSSFEANDLMRGEIRSKKDGRLDSISAKIILDRFIQTSQSLELLLTHLSKNR
jgi:putative Holliday junction resolvase